MRLLDFGCGMGDVSMRLARAVGPSGQVVGIDREKRAIDTARTRAAAAGHDHFHQNDPAAMMRRAAAVRPGFRLPTQAEG